MWFYTLVVFIAAMMQTHYHPVFAHDSYNKTCRSPSGQVGRCKRLQSCETLLQFIDEDKAAGSEFLEKSICSIEQYGTIVCCTDADTAIVDRFTNDDKIRFGPVLAPSISRSTSKDNNRYGPLLAPQCGIANPVIPERLIIVAGGLDAELAEWPWLAVLGYKDSQNPGKPMWLCGGSLISHRHVLTAAHCVHGRNDLYLVRLGEHDLGNDRDGSRPIDVGIQKFSIHPQYNPQTFTNDIAVLKLRRDVQFTRFIRPICLPVTENLRRKSFVDTFPFIAGWGSLYFAGPRSSKLQKVQVPIVSKAECQKAFEKFKNVTIDDRVTCGGFDRGGKGACQGDSGGPIMLNQGQYYYAIAVISYGYKCATPGIPGVFSRTNAFLDFILPLLN